MRENDPGSDDRAALARWLEAIGDVDAFFGGGLAGTPGVQLFQYAIMLRAMGERSLVTDDDDNPVDTFRLLLIPSFESPTCIRAEGEPRPGRLTRTVLPPDTGWIPGQVESREVRGLSRDEWRALQEAATASAVWTLPPWTDHAGLDGAELLLEVRAGKEYFVARRWSPERVTESAFRAVCDRLQELAERSSPPE